MQKNLYALLTTLVLTGLLSIRAQAQINVSLYSFAAVDTAYTWLAADSSILEDPLPNDDRTFNDVTLGFSFPWRASRTSSISISTNGALSMDPSAGLSGIFNAGSGAVFTAGYQDVVAWFNADLTASSEAPTSLGIKRGTQNGQRYFALIGKRVRRYDSNLGFAEGFAGDSINVQCWLWESGRINIIYGPSAIDTDSRTIQVGLQGDDEDDVLALSGTWAAPTTSSDPTASITASTAQIWRQAGRMFTFRPPVSAVTSLTVRDLVLPGVLSPLCAGQAQQTIQARVLNLGSDTVRTAQVCYTVNGGTPVCQTVTFTPALAQYQSRVVSFSGAQGANLAVAGNYNIVVYGTLTGDNNTSDDTVRFATRTGGDVNLPTTTSWDTYDEISTGGWTFGSGRNGMTPYDGFAIEEYDLDPPNSTLNVFQSGFTDTTHLWVIRHGFVNTDASAKAIAFTLAVGSVDFVGGLDPMDAGLDDDTIGVNISFDCGMTWRRLRSFTQADVISGALTNELNPFVVGIPGLQTGQTFSLAFEFNSNGTPGQNFTSYDILLDDIHFAPPTDASAMTVRLDNNLFTSCLRSTQEVVRVRAANLGSSPLSNFQVSYRLNNGAAVSQTITGPIASGEDTVVVFSGAQGANLSAAGSYTISAYVTATGDNFTSNDSASVTTTIGGTLDPITLQDRYETIQDLEDEGFLRYSGEGAEMREVQTNTFTGGFPPIWDETSVVAVSESTPANTVDWFLRPSYQLSNSRVGFAFSLLVSERNDGADTISNIGDDTLQVVASNDCGATWTVLRTFSQADLTAGTVDNTMRTFKVGVPFSSGSLLIGWRYDAAGTAAPRAYRWQMDSVRFEAQYDAQALAIRGVPTFLGYCFGDAIPVTLRYRNNGASSIDTVTVSYSYPGAGPFTQTVVRPLAVGAVDSVTFTAPLVLTSRGQVRITATVNTPGDGLGTNNSVEINTGYGNARPLPAAPYTTLANLSTNGYTTGSGPLGLQAGGWTGSTSFGATNPTVQSAILANATGRQDLWLASTAYTGQASAISVRYRIAANSGATGTGLNPQVGADDSLKLLFRVNCGAWQLATAYTADDITNRNVTGQLTAKAVNVLGVAPGDTFQIAFLATNNGTAPTASYHWSLNSIFVTDVLVTNAAVQNLGLSLYPNPAHDRVRVDGLKGRATATLVDLQGRSLRSVVLQPGDASIDLNSLPTGTYLLQLETSEGRAVQRLVVE